MNMPATRATTRSRAFSLEHAKRNARRKHRRKSKELIACPVVRAEHVPRNFPRGTSFGRRWSSKQLGESPSTGSGRTEVRFGPELVHVVQRLSRDGAQLAALR